MTDDIAYEYERDGVYPQLILLVCGTFRREREGSHLKAQKD